MSERLADVARAGGLAGARGITPPIAERLEQAIEQVPTEASAQALRGFRGVAGPTTIRGGRRTLELMPAVALTVYFDVTVAFESTAVLARAVYDAGSLDEANEILRGMGVRSELDWELERPLKRPSRRPFLAGSGCSTRRRRRTRSRTPVSATDTETIITRSSTVVGRFDCRSPRMLLCHGSWVRTSWVCPVSRL